LVFAEHSPMAWHGMAWHRFEVRPGLHLLLGQTIILRREWRQPQEKRAPSSFDMIDTLHNLVSSAIAHDTREVLRLQAAVFDWTRFGVFTGSHVSEYAGIETASPTPAAASVWGESPIFSYRVTFLFSPRQESIFPSWS
jgi:hypothetical protein